MRSETMAAESKTATRYDVAILGTGVGGTILGAILARHGVRVLLLEQGTHPRFTIGESTIPETTMMFRVLAARYDVPEIAYLASHQLTTRHIGPTSGVKRNFSFVYHRPDEMQRPEESTQYPTAAPPMGPDVHLFRQDIDAYMLTVAVRLGATVFQRSDVTELDIDDRGVRMRTREGREYRSSFVVDAGGLKSALAHLYGLRVNPCEMKTRSRSIFTHMTGVVPYDACADDPRAHLLPSPLSEGTLHHLFEGGWMWVIPFDNHPASRNPLVSVGLNLQVDKYPKTSAAPEDEFFTFISRYPNLVRQFAHARAIREWTGTDRLQFMSTRSIGKRFCMLPHAFGFVDPLYSSGLGITMAAINVMGARIIQAVRDDDFSVERFEYVDHWMKRNIGYYDRLVAGSYTSFQSFPLWNAWTRLWMLGGILGAFGAFEMLSHCRHGKDPLGDPVYETYPFRGVQGSELREFNALFDASEAKLDLVRSGERSADEISAEIFALVRQSRLWPRPWGALDPKKRHTGTFRMVQLLRTGLWLKNGSPDGVRGRYYVAGSPLDTVAESIRDCRSESSLAAGNVTRLVRDYLFDWNDDWRKRAISLARAREAVSAPIAPPAIEEPLASATAEPSPGARDADREDRSRPAAGQRAALAN